MEKGKKQGVTRQGVNFRVTCSPRPGRSNPAPPDGVRLFNILHGAKHPEKKDRYLILRQLFLREGAGTFVVNLKDKTTATFVGKVLEQVADPDFTFTVQQEPVETVEGGEKFTPGERERKGRCQATIEREAEASAGPSSATFVLVGVEQKATYAYDGPTKKLTRRKRESRGARALVGSAVDTQQGTVPVDSPNPWRQEHFQPALASKACAIETVYGGPSAGMQFAAFGLDAAAAGTDDNQHVQHNQLPHGRSPDLFMHNSDDSKASGGNGSRGPGLHRAVGLRMPPVAGAHGEGHRRNWSEPAYTDQAGYASSIDMSGLAAGQGALDFSHGWQGGAADGNGAGVGSDWGCHQPEELQTPPRSGLMSYHSTQSSCEMGEVSSDNSEVVDRDSPPDSGVGVEGSTGAIRGAVGLGMAAWAALAKAKMQQMQRDEPTVYREGLEQMLTVWRSSKSWCDVTSMSPDRGSDEHDGSSGGGGEVSRQSSYEMIESVVRDALQSGEVAGGTELDDDEMADFTSFLVDGPGPSSPVADDATAEEGNLQLEPTPLEVLLEGGFDATAMPSPAEAGRRFRKGRKRAYVTGTARRIKNYVRRTESDEAGTRDTPSAGLSLNKSA